MCMPPMARHGCMPASMHHHCCFGAISIEDEVKMLEEHKQRLQSDAEIIEQRIAERKKKK